MRSIARYERIAGPARVKLGAMLKQQYETGRSIRDLATECDRSYAFIHQMLVEAGVALRGRGGLQRRKSC
ncbi:MAG: transcriptional regulator [Pseudonocardiales bacterium]|nr:MAG: transcriptional regulator [Pseudonocardiales bacterium]